RNMNTPVIQETHHIARPADGDCRGAEQIFENEVPADRPGDELAECGIGISIGAAGNGDHRGKLRIAQSGEYTCYSCDDEGDNNARPCVLCGRRAGKYKNPRADNTADAEGCEIGSTESTAQVVPALFSLCFVHQSLNWFCAEQGA